jgi:hypothetical protein
MMRMHFRFRSAALGAVGVVALLALTGLPAAGDAPDPARAVPFIEGGIGLEDAQMLDAERVRHPLEIRTAARRSGAYLADAHVTIRDAAGIVVFDRQLQAPRLLIDLPPGRYDVVGVYQGEVQRRSVDVPTRGPREVILYFPVQGESVPHKPGDD